MSNSQKALAPYPNVVLLLPSPDLDESVRMLRSRPANHRQAAGFLCLGSDILGAAKKSFAVCELKADQS